MLKTLSYSYGIEEEIEINRTYYFGQLWDGNGDGNELLESGCISLDNENIVVFKIQETNNDILQTLVKIVDIY